ncbi:MAG: FtsH protease activity modulator HflK [Candidatus Saelkia tenebricola]|nr:FtsH protease activity modulator HflK [Candidatus Saelkia tenebricola]
MDFTTPEDLLGKGKQELKNLKKSILPMLPIAIGLILLIFLKGMIYSVGPEEVGVVQRFGKYISTTLPGLHFKLPTMIDKVRKIKIKRVYKEEFGFRTTQSGIKTQYSRQRFNDESLMLTGDLNILDVRWVVQYRINDPVKFMFAIRNPRNAIRDVSEVIIRRLTGDYPVDDVLTTKREEINLTAQIEMQKLLDIYSSGIQIVTVKLMDVNPPKEVKAAFNEVNEAKQEKERLINQSWEAYNKAVPRAKGEAEKTIREAEGYLLDKVNRAQGDAQRFTALLEEYKKAPWITKKRLYLETMMQVLPKAKEKYIIDSEQSSLLPLFNIRKEGGE